ncbi:MAG: response regulator [Gammaproteobacteria bacterium]|nr:response regulator [Gammaproteobacteria bacterium]
MAEDTKILIVEDEIITAMDTQQYLTKLGYNVIGLTGSGEEAIEMARSQRPNLILMDIYLQGKYDGAQAAQKILEFCQVPIIFVTAYKDGNSFNRAKLCGPFGYLTKPFEKRDLCNAIELAVFKHNTQMQIATLHAQALLNDKLVIIGTLATGVIHEISNPLSWVLNQLNVIENKIQLIHVDTSQSKIIRELNESVKSSIEGGEKILDIVKNLKGFSRYDLDELSSINIHEIIHSAVKMASFQFRHKVKIHTEFSNEIPNAILSSQKLHHVFLNLIVNAIQSFDETQSNENRVLIKTSLQDTRICVEVSDTGKGIAENVMPNIFNPFFTTKPPGVGTGLGLSISRDIVQSLKGEITVKSELNKGSVFSVYFPLHVARCISVDETTHALSDKKILVVDDEPGLLMLLKNILGENNKITTISNGKSILNFSKKHISQFDLIISDLHMSGINGRDLYHYLLRQDSNLANRIIFTTGGVHDSLMFEFLASIKNPCLDKPFTSSQLLRVIHETLQL